MRSSLMFLTTVGRWIDCGWNFLFLSRISEGINVENPIKGQEYQKSKVVSP